MFRNKIPETLERTVLPLVLFSFDPQTVLKSVEPLARRTRFPGEFLLELIAVKEIFIELPTIRLTLERIAPR